MPLEFAKLGGNESYPKRDFDGGEDQSYGFNPAYKLQTGNLRGTQGVGYGGVKIDGARNRVTLEANNTRVTLGDTSDSDNITGVALADTTSGNNLVTLGRDITSGSATTGLMAYDGQNTKRMLAGAFPDGSVKIKLSQAGYDVATATDDQLIWSSDFNTFKIVTPETVTLTTVATGGTYSTTVPHTLGDVPAVLAYVELASSPGQFVQLPYTIASVVGTAVTLTGIVQYVITDTDIQFVISVDNSVAGLVAGTWNFKYYLMKETAKT